MFDAIITDRMFSAKVYVHAREVQLVASCGSIKQCAETRRVHPSSSISLGLFFYKTITLHHKKMAGRTTSAAIIVVFNFHLSGGAASFDGRNRSSCRPAFSEVNDVHMATCTAVLAAVADSLPLCTCILRALLFLLQAMPKPNHRTHFLTTFSLLKIYSSIF